MGSGWKRWIDPCLILPHGVYRWLLLLGGLTLAFVPVGAIFRAPGYFGVSDYGSARETCEHPPSQLRVYGRVWGCGSQLSNRTARFAVLSDELGVACDRRSRLDQDLQNKTDASTRPTLREEEAEIRNLSARLRELTGPPVWSELLEQLRTLFGVVLVAFAAILGVGLHARAVRVKPMARFAPAARRLFWCSACVTFVWAAAVTIVESLDPGKTGFDWASYCTAGKARIGPLPISWLAGGAFWLQHSTLLTLSAIIGLQLVTGWHVTKTAHVPVLDSTRPDLGVRSYVVFLQTWCFLIVIGVALVTAISIRGLASSRTNIESFFLGFGALPWIVWLVWRFLRNAWLIRDRWEVLRAQAPDPDKLPPDPTEGLISIDWWKVPALFASACAVASALLQWGGLGKLFGMP